MWLDRLNPEYLSTVEKTFDMNGKKITSQSNKEEWYTLKSKVYESMGMYEKCIEISEEALAKFEKFHNDNEIWLKKRIGFSLYRLGKSEEAIKIFKEILKVKNEWFLYLDLSRVYMISGDLDNALKFAFKGIEKSGNDDLKVNLYWYTGIHVAKIDKEAAIYFQLYSVLLKKKNRWYVNSTEDHIYTKHKDIVEKGARVVKNEINKFIKQYKQNNEPTYTGIIVTLLKDNVAGFIESEGNSYFFRMKDVEDKKDKIVKGTKVIFNIEDSFDMKKNKDTKIGVNIKLVD